MYRQHPSNTPISAVHMQWSENGRGGEARLKFKVLSEAGCEERADAPPRADLQHYDAGVTRAVLGCSKPTDHAPRCLSALLRCILGALRPSRVIMILNSWCAQVAWRVAGLRVYQWPSTDVFPKFMIDTLNAEPAASTLRVC